MLSLLLFLEFKFCSELPGNFTSKLYNSGCDICNMEIFFMTDSLCAQENAGNKKSCREAKVPMAFFML